MITEAKSGSSHDEIEINLKDPVLAGFWGAVQSGEIKPVIDTIYPYEQADAAQAQLSGGGHIGKILLSRASNS